MTKTERTNAGYGFYLFIKMLVGLRSTRPEEERAPVLNHWSSRTRLPAQANSSWAHVETVLTANHFDHGT